MTNIWKEKIFYDSADIIFEYDENIYKLHKQNLFTSPVLKKLILSGFKESYDNLIVLDTSVISKIGWELMLNYIYNKYSQIYKMFGVNINKHEFDIRHLNLNDQIELYITSDYFDISIIKEELEAIFNARILELPSEETFDNILEILQISPEIDNKMEKLLKSNEYTLFYFIIKCIRHESNYCKLPWEILNNYYSNVKERFKNIEQLSNKVTDVKMSINNLILEYFQDAEEINIEIITLFVIINILPFSNIISMEQILYHIEKKIQEFVSDKNKYTIKLDNKTTQKLLSTFNSSSKLKSSNRDKRLLNLMDINNMDNRVILDRSIIDLMNTKSLFRDNN